MILTDLIAALVAIVFSQSGRLSSKQDLVWQTLAGISVPDTPIIRAALQYARVHNDDDTYNHVMRTWLLGSVAMARNATLNVSIDLEAYAVGTILHDLGWDETPNSSVVSQDRRFEVDGAMAARDFIHRHPDGKHWAEERVQLVWDSIALHAESSIWQYKQPNVCLTGQGVLLDIVGPSYGLGITQEEYDRVWAAFPGQKMPQLAKHKTFWLCKTKPQTTYGKWP